MDPDSVFALKIMDAINGAFEYDFTLLPTGDEGTSTSTIGGENFGVCKGSENKEAYVIIYTV